MASAPRKIFKLPSICATTKPTSTMPVTAITTFLPTMVLHNATAGLLGHTLRDVLTGSDLRRSATGPSSNRVVMCCLQPLSSSSSRGTSVPLGAGNGEFQQHSASAFHRCDGSPWAAPGCSAQDDRVRVSPLAFSREQSAGQMQTMDSIEGGARARKFLTTPREKGFMVRHHGDQQGPERPPVVASHARAAA